MIIIIIVIIIIIIIIIIIQRKLMAISIVTPKNTKHQNCKNQKSAVSQAMIKKEISLKMFLKATTYSSKKILIWIYGGLQTTTVVLLPLVRLARHSYGMLSSKEVTRTCHTQLLNCKTLKTPTISYSLNFLDFDDSEGTSQFQKKWLIRVCCQQCWHRA